MNDDNHFAPPPPSSQSSASPAFDPYAPPKAALETSGLGDVDDETRRLELLGHEGQIRGIGRLYLVGGFFAALLTVFGVLGAFVGLVAGGDVASSMFFMFIGLFLYGGIAFLGLWIGNGLRKVDPKIKTPAIVTAGLGLIGFPIGTIVNAYLLYLLLGRKGTWIMNQDYYELIQRTPHLEPKTSPLAWAVLILFLVLVVILIVFGFGFK